jgi:hypothetical protein
LARSTSLRTTFERLTEFFLRARSLTAFEVLAEKWNDLAKQEEVDSRNVCGNILHGSTTGLSYESDADTRLWRRAIRRCTTPESLSERKRVDPGPT